MMEWGETRCVRQAEPALRLGDRQTLVGRDVFQDGHAAAQPMDFQSIHLGAIAEAEVQACAVVALIAAAAVHLVDGRQVTRAT